MNNQQPTTADHEVEPVEGDEQWIDHDSLPDYLQDGDR